MARKFRDLMAVVDELKGHCAKILEPDGDGLTSIQKQDRWVKLTRDIKRAGLSFSVYHDTDHGSIDNSNISLTWSTAVRVEGTGTITDVLAVGDYPIHLSVGKQVSVRFEPRRLGDWSERYRVGNRRFADLTKGSVYEFQGTISYGRFYFKQGPDGRFDFSIEGCGLAAFFMSLSAGPG